MANVSQFSTSAGSNNSPSPNGAPEGMAPSGVNDVIRENMAAVARWYRDQQSAIVTAGTGNDYTISTNNSHASLSDIPITVFRANRENTGAATLAVDGLAVRDLVRADGTDLVSGDIKANSVIAVAYNANQNKFFMLSPTTKLAPPSAATTVTAGIAEIATQAETDDGADNTRIVTPKTLKDSVQLRAAQATTSGTAFDFVSIPAKAKKITVIFSGVSLSGSEQILVQLGTASGVESSGYSSRGVRTTGGGGTNTTSSSGFVIFSGGSGESFSGNMTLTHLGGNEWVSSHTGDSPTAGIFIGGGNKTLSGVLDRVRITRSGITDTFDAGKVTLLIE